MVDTASGALGHNRAVIALVFSYEVREPEGFERAYGPEGEWAQFFGQGPGFIGTEIVEGIPKAVLDTVIEKIPMRRLGTPDEVARVVRFLLEDESAYITGAVYQVDGGAIKSNV